MMWSTLGLFLFIVVLAADSIKATGDTDSHDEHHGNHSFIQPRHPSCLDDTSLDSVTIYTPNYPRKYPSKTLVRWGSQSFGTCQLSSSVFKLRPRSRNGKCIDYLEVDCKYDGSSGPPKRFCGEELNGKEISIVTTPPSGIKCAFTFKSSKKRNKAYIGFNATVSSPPIITTTTPIPDTPTTPTIQDCYCGVYVPPRPCPEARDDKIVGGSNAVDNQFPWQAAMVWHGTFNKNSLVCGGSLINDQWVLTAAHCTDILTGPSEIQILLGLWYWYIKCGVERYDVVEIIQHSGYNDVTYDNDIALLKLDRRVNFGATGPRPVCLPINSNDPISDPDDIEATVSGYGTLEAGGNIPECLQWTDVHTMTNRKCQRKYPNEDITAKMICAAGNGTDSCQGDSGGPLTTNATCRFIFNPPRPAIDYAVQIGVVSWGYGCADPDHPGVYTRVTAFLDWIYTNTDWSIEATCPAPCLPEE